MKTFKYVGEGPHILREEESGGWTTEQMEKLPDSRCQADLHLPVGTVKKHGPQLLGKVRATEVPTR